MTKSMIDLPELIAKSEDGDFWSPSLGVSGIHVASEGNVGWSIPLGVATIGETYTPEGTYGTFSAGSPVAGIEAGFHEDNPEPGMASAGRNFELLDHNDNLVGYEIWHRFRSMAGHIGSRELICKEGR